jgi:hypothetical protein
MNSSPITEAHSTTDKKPKQRENTERHEKKPHMNVHSIALETQDVHVLVGQANYKWETTRTSSRDTTKKKRQEPKREQTIITC